jgi:cytochrome c biogenesis protein
VISRPELRDRAARLWWEYTRMRTAIIFLIGLVLIVLVGSFVPQQDTSDQTKVDQFLADNANLNALTSHLGFPLTQVFVSPVLYVLLGSLYIALAACVVRRGRALLVRTWRRYPRTPQYWGEWGSWLFHTSFFLLLIAVVWGKATGFEGIVTVVEGHTVTEARASFDSIREGLLFGRGVWPFEATHAGYQVRLDKFNVTYQANGQAQDYVSSVTVLRDGSPVMTKDVRVNDFLGYDDVEFYQQDYGWAPHLVVTNPQGRVVFDDSVEFFGEDKTQQAGVLKVPGFGFTLPGSSNPVQLGARMALYPDARTSTALGPTGTVAGASTSFSAGGPEPRNPVLEMQLWVGDLGLSSGAPQNVNTLDTTGMQPYYTNAATVPVGLGSSIQLPLRGSSCGDPVAGGCFTVTFASLPQYSLFHVKRDTGVPLVYASFFLVMTGLLTKLYIRPVMEARRRRRRRPSTGGRRGGDDAGGSGQPPPADDGADAEGAEERELVVMGAGPGATARSPGRAGSGGSGTSTAAISSGGS